MRLDLLIGDMRKMSVHRSRESIAGRAQRQRSWRHVHHSPLFWAGVLLSLAAISVYVFSEDLSWRPLASRTAPEKTTGSSVNGQ
jgi:hypothetical protein